MRQNKALTLTLVFMLACSAVGGSVEAATTGSDVYRARRQRFLDLMQGDGVAIVMSAPTRQEKPLEWFVDHTDNHDFIYLTGLEADGSGNEVLVLCAAAERYRELLYTSRDAEAAKRATGIEHVFPYGKFLADLSEALTDFSLMRLYQRGSKPVPTDISRSLGKNKRLYFNYPRFRNLAAPPPGRVEIAQQVRLLAPEVQLRPASDVLDRLRVVHDEAEIALLRRASDIAVKAFVASLATVRPGLRTNQVVARVDETFAAQGATPSFPTNVGQWATGSGAASDRTMQTGDLISYDLGAEIGHETSDFGRTIPVGGRFRPEVRELYEAAASVQKRVIGSVKPGITLHELQSLKNRMAKEAGLSTFTQDWGLSHYVGMDVHDVGDYEAPLQQNTCFVVEWRIERDGMSIRFEDVVLVTSDGHDWLTGRAPIDPADYERLLSIISDR